MNLKEWEYSLDSADAKPASTSECVAITAFIACLACFMIALTVWAIKLW